MTLWGFGSTGAAAAGAHPKASACQSVAAILSDGPDPSVDPVGYAEAQILPLRSVHTKVPSVAKAVRALDRAYKSYVDTDGGPTATAAVDRDVHAMNRVCPGAGAAP